MTKKQLQQAIRKALAVSEESIETGDCALKVYFYPMSGALFNQDEWEDFIKKDEITVRRKKVPWIVEQMGQRLAQIVREMNIDQEVYLSIIVYGMVVGEASFSYCYDLDGDGYTVSTFRLMHEESDEAVKSNGVNNDAN